MVNRVLCSIRRKSNRCCGCDKKARSSNFIIDANTPDHRNHSFRLCFCFSLPNNNKGIGSTTSPSPRTCSLEDIKCLTVDHAWPVNVRDEDCRCPKTCNQLKYTENSFKLSTWNAGGNGIPFAQKSSFRSEVLLPRMRLRRDVLFTFEDLVVSFGSAVTLFIGLNFLDAAMLLMWSAQGLYGLVIERNCKGRCNKVNSKT